MALDRSKEPRREGSPQIGRAWNAGASWHWRLEADGPPRPLTSCLNSQKPRPAANVLGASTHGAGVAVEVQRRAPSLLPCWVSMGRGADGFAPRSHEVERGHRFAGLSGKFCVRLLWRGHNEF